jgi:hypothetical protein
MNRPIRTVATRVITLLLIVSSAGAVSAWQRIVPSRAGGGANSVAVGPDGSIAATGVLRRNGNTWSFGIASFKGRTGAVQWTKFVTGSAAITESGTGIAVDSDGNVVAAGVVDNGMDNQDGAVVKLRGSDGALLWRYTLDGTGTRTNGGDSDSAVAVTVDGNGDVVVVGSVTNAGTGPALAVVKIAKASGTELWRHEIDDAAPSQLFFGASHALAVDGAGNVYVAGVTPLAGPHDWLVVKLSGTTGEEQWTETIDGTLGGSDEPRAIAVGLTGDVVVAGGLTETSSTAFSFGVVRLAGADGEELWRHSIDGTVASSVAHAVAFDSLGNVIASGLTQNSGSLHDFTVLKLAGASGNEMWRMDLTGLLAFGVDYSTDLRIDAADNVIAAGRFADFATSYDLAVVKLDGATGSEAWREQVRGGLSDGGFGEAYALTLGEHGDAVAAGVLTRGNGAMDSFAVIKLSQRVAGGVIRLTDPPGDSAKRMLSIKSKDAGLFTVAPGTTADPTLGGAALEIVNPATLEAASLQLPSAGWRTNRKPTGQVNYKYRDPFFALGPCDQVDLKDGRLLSAHCMGAGIGFSLDESTQGSLGIRLRLNGTGAVQTCMLFDGSSVRTDRRGTFVATKSAPPATCP